MKKSQIEQELLTATKLPEKSGEDRQKYLARLARATNALADPEYAKISQAAQTWIKSAVVGINSRGATPIPDFSDYVDSDAGTPPPPAPVTARPVTNIEAPPPPPASPAVGRPVLDDAGTPPNPNPAGAATPTSPSQGAKPVVDAKKKRGSTDYFRKLLIKDPNKKSDVLVKETTEAGFTISPSTAYVVYYETKNTMKALIDMGMLPKTALPDPPAEEPKAPAAAATPAPAAAEAAKA